MPFELPEQVLDLPGHEPLDLSRWDGRGVPATVLLSWAEDATITPSTVAVLESIDAAELAPADLPRLLKAWDRLESHAAPRRQRSSPGWRTSAASSKAGTTRSQPPTRLWSRCGCHSSSPSERCIAASGCTPISRKPWGCGWT